MQAQATKYSPLRFLKENSYQVAQLSLAKTRYKHNSTQGQGTDYCPHACFQVYEELEQEMNSEQDRPFICSAPGCSQVSLDSTMAGMNALVI